MTAPDVWNLVDRFRGMSHIGRAIMGHKLDRAVALNLRDRQTNSVPMREAWQKQIDSSTREINRLACTAAKNW